MVEAYRTTAVLWAGIYYAVVRHRLSGNVGFYSIPTAKRTPPTSFRALSQGPTKILMSGGETAGAYLKIKMLGSLVSELASPSLIG